ncbi:diguanylate cyclase [Arcobacter sp.]|uniref:diguanylate cyclase n=1 Tax=Arcobacter sp. TaxID=1872629 RepID=UPI003D0E8451
MLDEKVINDGARYKFDDLVDITEFDELLQSFYKATKIPNGLVNNEGKIITQAGWVSACSLFHRVNSESSNCCEESNLSLMKNLREGEVSYSKCKNGLIDYATPIVIDGKILATVFLGQVLEEKPNVDFFIEQAKKYNYDEKQYLKAINSVPIVTREKMEALMDCIVKMVQMLAQNKLSKLNESKLKFRLEKSTKQQIQLKDILDFSPVGVGWSNQDGKIEYVNHQFTKLFGYTIEDLPDLDTWYKKAYPDIRYRNEVIVPWHKEVASSIRGGTSCPELEVTVTCKDGSERRVFIRVSWIGNKRLVNFSDITNHWKSELRNRAHDRMLEMVAKGSNLNDILFNIVQTIESEDPTSLCSILLLDCDKEHLKTGVSSANLPKFYNEAIDGIKIGVGVGSCGTAAFLGERIIVEDILNHEYWQPYLDLAIKANLKACWSEPIISSSGEILGTFAIYHKEKCCPNLMDIERITFATNIAAIAIENRNVKFELEHRAYYDYLTNLPNRRYFIERSDVELSRFHRYKGQLSIMMFDIDFFKKINDKYGHSTGDLVLEKISDISRELLRDVDIIGRIGGEEFSVLLPQTSVDEAVKVAERLRMKIFETQIVLENEISLSFTASFGVASANNCDNIVNLLNRADLALYDAKNSGRNRVCLYTKENS